MLAAVLCTQCGCVQGKEAYVGQDAVGNLYINATQGQRVMVNGVDVGGLAALVQAQASQISQQASLTQAQISQQASLTQAQASQISQQASLLEATRAELSALRANLTSGRSCVSAVCTRACLLAHASPE